MEYLTHLLDGLPQGGRIIAFVLLAITVHLLVVVTRFAANSILSGDRLQNQKARSVLTLSSSALVFSLYFFATGFALQELGVPLTAYLASASVIGLAVGFGSQGVVQDVVMGLTLIFSDLLDVGDLVELSGQTGKVHRITMRFVELQNALGLRVFIPNRSIGNVINYPKGYVRLLLDVTLTGEPGQRDQMAQAAIDLMQSTFEQFPGIVLVKPSSEGRHLLTGGKEFIRIKFRIWPNRGQPIESTLVKEVTAKLRMLDDAYQDWMVAAYYEVE